MDAVEAMKMLEVEEILVVEVEPTEHLQVEEIEMVAIEFETAELFQKARTKTSGWSLSSVKISMRSLCLVLKLPNPPFHDNLNDLYRFFASKFVTFVGVQIEEDLNLLRENHGLVIRNVMEVGQIAAKACRVLLKVDSDKFSFAA
ncbi:hypothetical protein Bca52824_016228 [Brassica carinata]|uniref:Uncharacterized protein n=1 Tax=Brassica carinata TaxID=52824 RepID=A0A8X7W5Z8_BRACI|nr:hypothetical protein Bca52824_016228 [Brassica carinata]